MTTSNAGCSLETLLTSPQNLYWAWLKYQRYMQSVHTWIDDYRLSCFEANLQAELDAIARQFKRLTYRTEPIRPLPHVSDSQRLPYLQAHYRPPGKNNKIYMAQ